MKIDGKALLAEIRANRAKLKGCPCHRFIDQKANLGKKVTCNECGGSMCLTELSGYMAGFEAAGGNANDVWPGWSGVDAGVSQTTERSPI